MGEGKDLPYSRMPTIYKKQSLKTPIGNHDSIIYSGKNHQWMLKKSG